MLTDYDQLVKSPVGQYFAKEFGVTTDNFIQLGADDRAMTEEQAVELRRQWAVYPERDAELAWLAGLATKCDDARKKIILGYTDGVGQLLDTGKLTAFVVGGRLRPAFDTIVLGNKNWMSALLPLPGQLAKHIGQAAPAVYDRQTIEKLAFVLPPWTAAMYVGLAGNWLYAHRFIVLAAVIFAVIALTIAIVVMATAESYCGGHRCRYDRSCRDGHQCNHVTWRAWNMPRF